MVKMDIQKIKLISNNICYGPEPSPSDEVEQHLTISATGDVWFIGYNYNRGFGNYKIGREQNLFIDKTRAEQILSLISQYFFNNPSTLFATDIGQWERIIIDTAGKEYKFNGSLFGEIMVGDIDITGYIRENIPVDSLFVFDDIHWDEE